MIKYMEQSKKERLCSAADTDRKSSSLQKIKEGLYQLRVKRFYAMNFDFFEMEPHSHSEMEIMYAVYGYCTIHVWKSEERQEIILKEGEYIFLDAFVKHRLIIEKNHRCRLLNLEMALQKSEKPSWEMLTSTPSFTRLCMKMRDYLTGYDAARNLHMVITRLHGQMKTEAEEKDEQLMQQLLLLQLLAELGRQMEKVNKNERKGVYVSKALDYLKAHFEDELSIDMIARQVGTSSAYLQRLIREETGKTIIYLINELRIEKAKLLLETSSLPIVDIAVSIGFNNRQHFTHTFQKQAGCSPGLYRKQKGNDRVWQGF